ncbi:MAG TPA: DUF2802 domain-containing protein [Steroidobacteraceae bacterium]|nr:DUF2802 domain-containing protein [Steroidobacteraceae bacterium]HRX88180.1 DUF2802 domain-containing protein [Steroidobacteraceae bacterium]
MDLLQMTLESIATTPPGTLLWIGRATVIVIALLALIAALADLRHDARAAHQVFVDQLLRSESQLADLKERIAALSTGLSALAAHGGTALERERRSAPQGAGGYQAAIRLARNSAPVEELMATCGIHRPEAELLCRLYGAAASLPDGPEPARESAL